MPNSGHGGPPGTLLVTIFVFYVNPQIPNIENVDAFGGLQMAGGISSFSYQISLRMLSESWLGAYF